MKDNIEINKKAREDLQAIKDDMRDIVKRVGSLKDESLNALYENSEDLMSNMSELKNKILGQGEGASGKICSCIQKNPLKSALYAFGVGLVLALLFRK
jgi:ElaB/YqjD/DUF883 family membrane-anchored ribosome-binding protein